MKTGVHKTNNRRTIMKLGTFIGKARNRTLITLTALLAIAVSFGIRHKTESKASNPDSIATPASVPGRAPELASDQAVRQLKEQGLYDSLAAAMEPARARASNR